MPISGIFGVSTAHVSF